MGSVDELSPIDSVAAGQDRVELTPFTFDSIVFRVDALDDDNTVIGPTVTVFGGRPDFRDANGEPVYLLETGGGKPYTTDFDDFLIFASTFNKNEGEDGYLVLADIDGDGEVGFTDFILFAGSFGSTATTLNGSPIEMVLTKRVLEGE